MKYRCDSDQGVLALWSLSVLVMRRFGLETEIISIINMNSEHLCDVLLMYVTMKSNQFENVH